MSATITTTDADGETRTFEVHADNARRQWMVRETFTMYGGRATSFIDHEIPGLIGPGLRDEAERRMAGIVASLRHTPDNAIIGRGQDLINDDGGFPTPWADAPSNENPGQADSFGAGDDRTCGRCGDDTYAAEWRADGGGKRRVWRHASTGATFCHAEQ